MTATPEKVRALTELLADAAPALVSDGWDFEDLAQRMLRSGRVDIEVPEPAPTYQPGDVAIATVGALQGVHVLRAHNGWYYADRYESGFVPDNDDEPVTVTSRAVVVTEADRDTLLDTAEYLAKSGDARVVRKVIREWFDAVRGGSR